MFETRGFKAQLAQVVSEETTKSQVSGYEPMAISFLVTQARLTERASLRTKDERIAFGKRDVQVAFESARILARDAAQYALEDGRDVVTQTDMAKAWRANFCRVWPFCR